MDLSLKGSTVHVTGATADIGRVAIQRATSSDSVCAVAGALATAAAAVLAGTRQKF